MQFSFHFAVDPCYHYSNLSEANRNKDYRTLRFRPVFCDNQLFDEWYRFVGDAGTKMPTTRVSAYRCGTNWSGWLNGAHPTLEDGEVRRKVCFSDHSAGCQFLKTILVKNCGSYFIYRLYQTSCMSRYCGTDWMWSKYTSRSKKTHKSLRRYMCISFLCDIVNLSSLSWTLSADFNFGGKQVFISLEW